MTDDTHNIYSINSFLFLFSFFFILYPRPTVGGNVDVGNTSWTGEDDTVVIGGDLAARVAMGIGLYMLAMVTCVGNGMVIHAIRTEKRLRKVSRRRQ